MARPRLLTSDDWPEPELRAAVLAGELVPVGACWASPAEPQTPALRAAAVAWELGDERLVAATRTAAWIWGAVSRAPAPVEVVVPPQVRVHVEPGVRRREVALAAEDVVAFGRQRVTVPVRTALDLLRTPGSGDYPYGPAEAAAVAGLLAVAGAGAEELRTRLGALGRVPMVRQAERRLRLVTSAGPGSISRR